MLPAALTELARALVACVTLSRGAYVCVRVGTRRPSLTGRREREYRVNVRTAVGDLTACGPTLVLALARAAQRLREAA